MNRTESTIHYAVHKEERKTATSLPISELKAVLATMNEQNPAFILMVTRDATFPILAKKMYIMKDAWKDP